MDFFRSSLVSDSSWARDTAFKLVMRAAVRAVSDPGVPVPRNGDAGWDGIFGTDI